MPAIPNSAMQNMVLLLHSVSIENNPVNRKQEKSHELAIGLQTMRWLAIGKGNQEELVLGVSRKYCMLIMPRIPETGKWFTGCAHAR
ncbi:hypothetical protein [Noviherbaspirillum sp.]|jgi:hypothetical protein|uniref:hypothetical protein n=1 Tax=Noviherbaspirillum sp. TaxID=1926288 RepID=UPI002DDD68A8|nr:hypothetical protein [Noviherbaspirillum sp.]